MISVIGLMIGMYILVRMLDLVLGEVRPAGVPLKIFAYLTILAAAFGVLVMFLGVGTGQEGPTPNW